MTVTKIKQQLRTFRDFHQSQKDQQPDLFQFNKLMSVFHASVLNIIDHEFCHNVVTVIVDPRGDSIHSYTHPKTQEKLTSICFFLNNKFIAKLYALAH